MNPQPIPARPVWHIGLGFLLAACLFAVLVLAVKASMHPPAIDAQRAALRAKDLAEIRAIAATNLDQPGWVNRQGGIVRLPIAVAMKLAVQEWQRPAIARSNLLAREAGATAPPPKPAAKSNPFE